MKVSKEKLRVYLEETEESLENELQTPLENWQYKIIAKIKGRILQLNDILNKLDAGEFDE